MHLRHKASKMTLRVPQLHYPAESQYKHVLIASLHNTLIPLLGRNRWVEITSSPSLLVLSVHLWVLILSGGLRHQRVSPQPCPNPWWSGHPRRIFSLLITGQDSWYSQLIVHLVRLPGRKTALFVPSSAFSAAAVISHSLPFPGAHGLCLCPWSLPQRRHWQLQKLCPEHGPWEETKV